MKSGMFGKTFFITVALVLSLFALGLSFFTLSLEKQNPRIQRVMSTVTVMPSPVVSATPSAAISPKVVMPFRQSAPATISPSAVKK